MNAQQLAALNALSDAFTRASRVGLLPLIAKECATQGAPRDVWEAIVWMCEDARRDTSNLEA